MTNWILLYFVDANNPWCGKKVALISIFEYGFVLSTIAMAVVKMRAL